MDFKNMSSYEIKQACLEAMDHDNVNDIRPAIEWLHLGDVRDLAQMSANHQTSKNCFVYFLSLLERSPTIVTALLCDCARTNHTGHIEEYLKSNKLNSSHPSYAKILVNAVRHGSTETVDLMTSNVPPHLCSTAMIEAIESRQTNIVNLLSERTPKADVPHIFYECMTRGSSNGDDYLLFLDEKISELEYSDFVPTFKKIHPLLKTLKMENVQARHVKNQLQRSIVRAVSVEGEEVAVRVARKM